MVDKPKVSRVIDTWKQKRWYKIISPPSFGSRQIGETIAIDDAQVHGRTISVSLAAVTGDVKKQNTNAIFEVNNVKNDIAETILKKMEIAPSSIRRMMRKGRDRIDLSIVCATKDNVVCRIKPFLVTRSKTGGAVLTRMRKLLEDVLRVEANKVTFENLIRDVVIGKLQRTVKQYLNKLYPVRTSEIRSIEETVATKPLPPIPKLPEIKEEHIEETEEEKIEKKVKAKAAEEKPAEAKKTKKKVAEESVETSAEEA